MSRWEDYDGEEIPDKGYLCWEGGDDFNNFYLYAYCGNGGMNV